MATRCCGCHREGKPCKGKMETNVRIEAEETDALSDFLRRISRRKGKFQVHLASGLHIVTNPLILPPQLRVITGEGDATILRPCFARAPLRADKDAMVQIYHDRPVEICHLKIDNPANYSIPAISCFDASLTLSNVTITGRFLRGVSIRTTNFNAIGCLIELATDGLYSENSCCTISNSEIACCEHGIWITGKCPCVTDVVFTNNNQNTNKACNPGSIG
eukprot:TRINITY_DN40417_c0_g1_i1.p1 TRINITY_DN40417_c0_g1~~TRINITY_DN40417_c0_g1_i1.p1  ORF type:complete len:219 (+),score=23.22 TRINITY_DN40417_c0_g1_i1:23-679(+)